MWKSLSTMALAVVFCGVLGCEVTKTEEGRAPDVDVQVDPGKLPHYDVDAPDVDVKSKEVEVTVPDVDVHTEKKTVTVPDIDVIPADQDKD